jgi:hypothetical protein
MVKQPDELAELLMDTQEFIDHCLPVIKDTHDFILDNLQPNQD